MPTGYTAPVMDGEVTELRDYLLLIARAFGGFIHQRDEGSDVPPRAPEFDSYHARSLPGAKADLQRYQQMTLEQAEKLQDEEIAATLKRNEESVAKAAVISHRYEHMIEQVDKWQPPTEEHEGIKKLALEQLHDSIKFDGTGYIVATERLPAQRWLDIKIAKARESVERHTEGLRKDKISHAKRVAWVETFFASLPEKGPTT